MRSRILEKASPAGRDAVCVAWPGGSFELGSREKTPQVNNTLAASEPILMVTLQGGARRLQQRTDDGHRFTGPDVSGSFSFLPAGCGRRIVLEDVAWKWAAITVSSDPLGKTPQTSTPCSINCKRDVFIHSLLMEMGRLYIADKWIDPAYCESVSTTLAHYLARRYWHPHSTVHSREAEKLSDHQLRIVEDYVEAHIDEELRIAKLADLVGLSVGQFHRSFRASTGRTPLEFISERRVEAARDLLTDPDTTVLQAALSVGISSPSHFARLFRSVAGVSPGAFRKAHVRQRSTSR